MLKRFHNIRRRKNQKPSLYWLLALPPAAFTVAWGLRRAVRSGSRLLSKKAEQGLVPATGAGPLVAEMEPKAKFRDATSEQTVHEMAAFKPSHPETSTSVRSVPPTASEDSPVEVSGPLGLHEAEDRRSTEMGSKTSGIEQQRAVPEIESARTFDPNLPSDDFRIIEGIGPSITGILHNAGIQTFRQLAEAPKEDLQEILRQAGLSHLADPTTWPEQARLAADEKWDELTQMQDNLEHGRRKK